MRIGFHKAIRSSREVGYGPNRAGCPPEPAGQRWGERAPAIARTTVLAVDVDLGSNNAVFIRGRGAGLRWDKGQQLACVGPRIWVFSAEASGERVEFQLLLNDEVWARGETRLLDVGGIVEVTPDFEWPEIPRICPSQTVACR
jgi:hypothetical protein